MIFRRALVTGGAGFIGSHLVPALLAEGLSVTVLDDLSMGNRDRVPSQADLRIGDVRHEDDVDKSLEGVDIVFHLAARVSIRASVEHFYRDADTNLMGTLNLLRCCARHPVRKIVYASSMAVYCDYAAPKPIPEDSPLEPISPYGISKLAGEKYCLQFAQNHDISCHVLRYFNTFGSGQTLTPYVGVITIFCHGLLQNKPPTIFGDGQQQRDFVHVSDIVQANLLAMHSSLTVGIFNVGTGQATSVNELAHWLCQRLAPDLRPVHSAASAGELRNSVADLTRIREALGYQPRVHLRDRLDEVIESCRQIV